MKHAMIIAAHPDDAEIAMGGTIVKMTQIGWDVTVVDLTDGEPTPFGAKPIRQKEIQAANLILGITRRICLDMPNRRLQATMENRIRLAETIRLYQPDILFSHFKADYHPDHIAASELAAAARFEAKLCKTILKGKLHWTPKLFHFLPTSHLDYIKPSFLVDISDVWDKKIKAVQAYESQLKLKPYNRCQTLSEQLEITCRYFGLLINAKYAEPFLSCELLEIIDLTFFNH